MKAEVAVGLIFAVSALPVFWVSTPVGILRFAMWYFSPLIFGIARIYGRLDNRTRERKA